jgi:hypothetical protein
MLKLIPIAPALVLFVLSGEGLYHASRSREPVALTCDQFSRSRPSSHLVRLVDCVIDYTGAGYRESGGRLTELFVPVRPTGAPPAQPASLVAATRDGSALAIADSVLGGGRGATPEQSVAVMQKAIGAVQQQGAVIEGLVRSTIIDQVRARRLLSGLATPVAANAAIVDLGARPSFVTPLAEVAGGVLLLALTALLLRRGPREIAVSVPAAIAAAALPSPAAARSGAFDRGASYQDTPPGMVPLKVMLLNLDAAAGADALEHAPPLGTRDEVVAILKGVVPDLAADPQRGPVLVGAAGALTVDLGSDDPVATAVLEGRSEAGPAIVREILDMTGWRAFAPKRGRFIDADELDAWRKQD